MGVAAACYKEFHRGDPDSAAGEAWALLEAERTLAFLGLVDGLAGMKKR